MSMKEFWSWVVMGIAFLTIVVLGIMQQIGRAHV